MEQTHLYKKGFNAGYLISKYNPNIIGLILKNLVPTTDYLQGLFNGKEEYEHEKFKLTKEELSKIRTSGREDNLERSW